ncbi:MAG: N-formylglutamate amidohydrolase, partial [Myxococcales bacterium]|nr:N-formylglutamate amidohydrolase [Myxococcales bacterium]
MTETSELLGPEDPPAVSVDREAGGSHFFLTCDHAGRAFPRALGDLGVSAEDRRRHVAWDVGAAGLALELSRNLDATLVQQNYSRLVIDSNRPLGNSASIPVMSEDVVIPGNRDLRPEDIARRRDEIFKPYHDTIETLLDRRIRANRATTLVAVHSFTPTFHGKSRPWDIGLLYHREKRLADALLRILADEAALCVGDNEPYQVTESED